MWFKPTAEGLGSPVVYSDKERLGQHGPIVLHVFADVITGVHVIYYFFTSIVFAGIVHLGSGIGGQLKLVQFNRAS